MIFLSLCSCTDYNFENNKYSDRYFKYTVSNSEVSSKKVSKTSTKSKIKVNKKNSKKKADSKQTTKSKNSKKEISKTRVSLKNNKSRENNNKTNTVKSVGRGLTISGGFVKNTVDKTAEDESGGKNLTTQTLATTTTLPTETTTLAPLKDTDTAYITKYGKKYHRENCGYLYKSKIPIIVGEAKEKGYSPCTLCNP